MVSGAEGHKFAVGIVHFRDPLSVVALIESIRKWTIQPEIIFIADNSGEFTHEDGIRMSGDVQIADMGANVGYGPAANRLLDMADAKGIPYLLLLTQDAALRTDSANQLLEQMASNPDCAVAAPILLFVTRPDTIFSSGGIITKHSRTLHPGQGEPLETMSRGMEPYDVDWVDGACTLLRVQDCLHLGGFDPAYFLYVEEVDLQFRLREAGRRIVVVPTALAQQEPGNYSLYYKYRNLTYFSRKHRGRLRPWPWLLALPKDSARRIMEGKSEEILWGIRGLWDSYSNRMGQRPQSLFHRDAEATLR
jgi:GT2 family glycosyltransferase